MPGPREQRSSPASNWRCSSSVYLVTSGLATTPLMSDRATLIEHVEDGSISVRLTMISTRDPSQPAVAPWALPPFAQRPFSDHDDLGRVAQRDLCDRSRF